VANTPAYEGVCAFNFNGSAKESSRAERLYRNVDGLVAGDTLTLSGYAKGINAQPNTALVALVTYSNGQRETLRVPLAGGTYEYTLFSQSLTLSKPSAVKEILVRLVSISKSGRVIIDNVALTVQYPASSGALAPLPPAP